MGHLSLMHVAVLAAVVVAVVALLWPTEGSGRRLLRSWGVPDSDRTQRQMAKRYLLLRRALSAVFLPLPLMGYAGWEVVLLATLLLAEFIASFAPVRGNTRSATLRRRSRWDLAPHWVVTVYAVFAIVALLSAGLVWLRIVKVTATDHWIFSTPAITAATVIATTVAVGLVLQLATVRPCVGDVTADAALRARSARVAIALGSALVANQAFQQLQWIDGRGVAVMGWCVLAGGILAWIVIAVPLRRPRIVAVVE